MNTINFGENTQLWLDRLACGELDEQTRGSLLAWLDTEPLRWRACALALLEVQTWHEALEPREATERVEIRRPELQLTESPTRSPSRQTKWIPAAVLSASVLIAFSLGALSRSWMTPDGALVEKKQQVGSEPGEPAISSGPLMATVALKPELHAGVSGTLRIPVRSVGNQDETSSAPSISEYDRQKWERRGYQLIKERRFLPAELPDGRKVVVPMEQVKAHYVGSKVS